MRPHGDPTGPEQKLGGAFGGALTFGGAPGCPCTSCAVTPVPLALTPHLSEHAGGRRAPHRSSTGEPWPACPVCLRGPGRRPCLPVHRGVRRGDGCRDVRVGWVGGGDVNLPGVPWDVRGAGGRVRCGRGEETEMRICDPVTVPRPHTRNREGGCSGQARPSQALGPAARREGGSGGHASEGDSSPPPGPVSASSEFLRSSRARPPEDGAQNRDRVPHGAPPRRRGSGHGLRSQVVLLSPRHWCTL